jgi:hypothetical protein
MQKKKNKYIPIKRHAPIQKMKPMQNYAQVRMPPPKNAMCVFFINENKNATLISNKDEEEKRQEKEREN